jgi:hypothetical protein
MPRQLPFDRAKGAGNRGHHFAFATGLLPKPIGPALIPKQVDYAVRLYLALGDHFGKSARHEKQYLVALAARRPFYLAPQVLDPCITLARRRDTQRLEQLTNAISAMSQREHC